MKPIHILLIASVLTVCLNAQAINGGLKINEAQFTNKNTLVLSDGSSPDWIEIINTSDQSINLKNYSLADGIEQDKRWYFHDTTLAAQQIILVYASGLDSIINSELHTQFKLSVLEDSLFLLNPAGEVVDQINAQCVPPDYSIGRCLYQSGMHIQKPTPGSENNGEIREINFQYDALELNYESGFYSDNIELKVNNKVSENEVRYTLNANEPSFNSLLYSEPIELSDINANENRFANYKETTFKTGNLIEKANVVRIQSFSEGCPASKEEVRTFFIRKQLSTWAKKIPAVSLVTDKDNLFSDEAGIYVLGNHNNYYQHGKEWERPIHVEMFDTTLHSFLKQDAGVRIHGRASRRRPQKALRLYARSKYEKDAFSYPFFSQKPHLNAFKTLLLRPAFDWSDALFKDEFSQYVVDEMDIDYTAAETTVLFVNGEYWGLYSLRERHDEHYVANNYNIPTPELNVVGIDPLGISVESGDISPYNHLLTTVSSLNNYGEEDFEVIDNLIDVDAFIDYYIAQIYLGNTDFPHNNHEFWKMQNDTSKWRLFFFDMDGIMQSETHNLLANYNNNEELLQVFTEGATDLLRNLLQNTVFRERFKSKFFWHVNHTFNPEKLMDKLLYYEDLYSSLVADNIYRWGMPADVVKWKQNVEELKHFIVLRPMEVYTQLEQNFGVPFSVYPNPSSGSFQIQFANEVYYAKAKIYTSDGRLVHSQLLNGTTYSQIETSLIKGLYLLEVEYAGVKFIQKIIINN